MHILLSKIYVYTYVSTGIPYLIAWYQPRSSSNFPHFKVVFVYFLVGATLLLRVGETLIWSSPQHSSTWTFFCDLTCSGRVLRFTTTFDVPRSSIIPITAAIAPGTTTSHNIIGPIITLTSVTPLTHPPPIIVF
ncbi:hypothetical protein K439DRAFT_874103 [Ramaria rubella]|nr:hypothetical protein K439DRAFT_874103 [Ramaria rubella]